MLIRFVYRVVRILFDNIWFLVSFYFKLIYIFFFREKIIIWFREWERIFFLWSYRLGYYLEYIFLVYYVGFKFMKL